LIDGVAAGRRRGSAGLVWRRSQRYVLINQVLGAPPRARCVAPATNPLACALLIA